MPSNALSQKSFGTKTPAVCHPPPWPPAVPIPPIAQATFFCFASIRGENPDHQPPFAASCILRRLPTWYNWYGKSLASPNGLWIEVDLSEYYAFPKYKLNVRYWWPGPFSWNASWTKPTFSETRPYVGETLERHFFPPPEIAYAVIREIPP